MAQTNVDKEASKLEKLRKEIVEQSREVNPFPVFVKRDIPNVPHGKSKYRLGSSTSK